MLVEQIETPTTLTVQDLIPLAVETMLENSHEYDENSDKLISICVVKAAHAFNDINRSMIDLMVKGKITQARREQMATSLTKGLFYVMCLTHLVECEPEDLDLDFISEFSQIFPDEIQHDVILASNRAISSLYEMMEMVYIGAVVNTREEFEEISSGEESQDPEEGTGGGMIDAGDGTLKQVSFPKGSAQDSIETSGMEVDEPQTSLTSTAVEKPTLEGNEVDPDFEGDEEGFDHNFAEIIACSLIICELLQLDVEVVFSNTRTIKKF